MYILSAKQHFRQTREILLTLAFSVIINKIPSSLKIFERKKYVITVINIIIVFLFIVHLVFTFQRPLTFTQLIVSGK